MPVFENVRDVMLSWDARKNPYAGYLEDLRRAQVFANGLATGDQIRSFVNRINDDLLRRSLPDIAGVAGTDLALHAHLPDGDVKFLNVQLLSWVCLNVVNNPPVTNDMLQSIAITDTNLPHILAALNAHSEIFLGGGLNFNNFDLPTLQSIQAKITQTLIERKILAARNPADLGALVNAANENAVRAVIFQGGGFYGDLPIAAPGPDNLLPDNVARRIQAQAKAMQALLNNATISSQQCSRLMTEASFNVASLEGLTLLAAASQPPTQIDFSQCLPTEAILAAITNANQAKAAIVLLKQFPAGPPGPAEANADLPRLLAAATTLEEAVILRALVVEFKLLPSEITGPMLGGLANIPGANKLAVIRQLFNGTPEPDNARKVDLVTEFIRLPNNQRLMEVAKGFSMMTAPIDRRVCTVIGDIVIKLQAARKTVREKDFKDAIGVLSVIPPGNRRNQYDKVANFFRRLNDDIRSAEVAKALERSVRGKAVQKASKGAIVYLLAKNGVLEAQGLANDIIDRLYQCPDITRLACVAAFVGPDKKQNLDAFIERKIVFIAECFGDISDDTKRTLDVINLLIANNPGHDGLSDDDRKKRALMCRMIVGLVNGAAVNPIAAIDPRLLAAVEWCPDEKMAEEIGQAMSVLVDDPNDMGRVLDSWDELDGWDHATPAVAEALVRYKTEDFLGAAMRFESNNHDKRDAVVQLANAGLLTARALSETVVEAVARLPQASRQEAARLLSDKFKTNERALETVAALFKQAESPTIDLLKRFIEAETLKFELVPVKSKSDMLNRSNGGSDPKMLRKTLQEMKGHYKTLSVLWREPGGAVRPTSIDASSPPVTDSKPCGFEVELKDGLGTTISEHLATKSDGKHRVNIIPGSVLTGEPVTLKTAQEAAMYAKRRGLIIDLGKMGDDVKVKVMLHGEEKEVPFKALFFLALAAQELKITENGRTVFQKVSDKVENADQWMADSKTAYLKALGISTADYREEQLIELRELFRPDKASATFRP